MQISPAIDFNNIKFKAKIIDSHGHVGSWKENERLVDYTSDIDVFIKSPLLNGDTVEKIIVSNLDCMSVKDKNNFLLDEIEGNKKLLNLIRTNKKLVAMLTCQPGYGKADNIRKILLENSDNIVGLKFHPEQLKILAKDKSYIPYIEIANEYKLPCLFHTGSSMVSNPDNVYEIAKKYPEVKFIMAHWGAEEGGNYDKVTEMIIESVKTKKAQIYADISWVDCNNSSKPTIKKFIKDLKKENALDRILFGSDAPLGRFSGEGENSIKPIEAYTNLIEDIKKMIKKEFPTQEAEEIIEKIFYKNSKDIFFKKKEPPLADIKKNRYLKYIVITILAIIATYELLKKKISSKKISESTI